MRITFRMLLASFLSAVPLAGFGKTFYVDSVFGGDFAGTACTKANPCTSIQDAIDLTTAGSRIVVFPGDYPENLELIEPRVKLTSVAGARATKLIPDNSADAVVLNDEKIVFGQKGKGFHVAGNPGGNDILSIVNAKNSKVEGNILSPSGTAEYGILALLSPGLSIRYNTISGVEKGILGFNWQAPAKATISDNEITDVAGGKCLELGTVLANSRIRISGNHIRGCTTDGIFVAGTSDGNYRTRIDKNVVAETGTNGIYLSGTASEKSNDVLFNNVLQNITSNAFWGVFGNPQLKRNLIRDAGHGIFLDGTDGVKIQDNLVQAANFAMNHGPTTINTTVKGNHFLDPVEVQGGAVPFNSFTRNNIPFCGLQFQEDSSGDPTIVTSKNFWTERNNDGIPDFAHCGIHTSSAYSTYNTLLVNPVTKPNPVKYKGGL